VSGIGIVIGTGIGEGFDAIKSGVTTSLCPSASFTK